MIRTQVLTTYEVSTIIFVKYSLTDCHDHLVRLSHSQCSSTSIWRNLTFKHDSNTKTFLLCVYENENNSLKSFR